MKLKNTNLKNDNWCARLERKLCHLWGDERNRWSECNLKAHPNLLTGFTILEVMVALAIVGISIGIFFSSIGNSSRLKGKIDGHTELLLLARTKTEEAFLGILGKKPIKANEKKTFEGVTKDEIHWQVSETDKYEEAIGKASLSETENITDTGKNTGNLPPKGMTLLRTLVGGITIETIFFARGPEELEGDSDEEREAAPDTDISTRSKGNPR